jgi:two-component system copper resistance phosphate regulon response regulator CusR
MRVLLIEGDAATAERIRAELQRAHFTVDIAAEGETGLRRARQGVYALVLLNAVLPGRDGLSVCQALRAGQEGSPRRSRFCSEEGVRPSQEGSPRRSRCCSEEGVPPRRDTVPILMLTTSDGLEDRIRTFESGADGFLVKPFEDKDLLARVQALLRRGKVHRARMIRIADLEIDTWARRVQRGGSERFLTSREFALLQALAVNEGRALSREIILEHVWGDAACGPDTVNFHIASLRKKIDAGHNANSWLLSPCAAFVSCHSP